MKKLIRRLAGLALVALGFSSCALNPFDDVDNLKEGPLMYGTPTASFSIKGKVTDATQPSKAIPGIRIIFQSYWNEHTYEADTVFTTANGTYDYQSRYVHKDASLRAVIEDVDGADNGSYRSKTVPLTSDQTWTSERLNAWQRKVAKEGLDFTLDPEKPQ